MAYERVKPTFIYIRGVIFRWVDTSLRKSVSLRKKKSLLKYERSDEERGSA